MSARSIVSHTQCRRKKSLTADISKLDLNSGTELLTKSIYKIDLPSNNKGSVDNFLFSYNSGDRPFVVGPQQLTPAGNYGVRAAIPMDAKHIENPDLVLWSDIKDRLPRRHALNVMIRSMRVQEELGAVKIGRVWYVDAERAARFDPDAWTQRGKPKRAKPRIPKQDPVPRTSTCKANPVEGMVTLKQAGQLVGLTKLKMTSLMRNPRFRESVSAYKPDGCTAWLLDEQKLKREFLLTETGFDK